jgi:ankyrin repeat protein
MFGWLTRGRLHKRLWDAIYNGDIGSIITLVQKGAHVNSINNLHDWDRPLGWAIGENNMPLVALVELGADLEDVGNDCSALGLAAYGCREALVEFLISKGADVNRRDGSGCTPLMWARQGHYPVRVARIVKLLTDAGARE